MGENKTRAQISIWYVVASILALSSLPVSATLDIPAAPLHELGTSQSLAYTQENGDLTQGPGIKAHWDLTELIGSTANAFDSATADVDDDGELEIIVSKNSMCEFYCLKQDGAILWSTSLLSTHKPGYYGGEVIDIDNDGRLEFVTAADNIWVFDAATGIAKWTVPNIGGEPDEAPWRLGQVSSNDKWDIIIARTHNSDFVVTAYNWEGSLIWSTAIENATYGHTISPQDVDGDGYDEIFIPCSSKTVAIDSDGQIMWVAPLTSNISAPTREWLLSHDLPISNKVSTVTNWWYHSDFAQVADLYSDGHYYVLHDYGGGVLDPTSIQILDAMTGEVVDSFTSTGHHQWLQTMDLRTEYPGQEIVYVTREKVVMRNSALDIIWEKKLSGAHELGLGDWNGDNQNDIIVSTIFRGLKTFAGVDSNFLVYSAYGDAIYNMLYRYPQDSGKYTGAQMQNAMKKIRDYDGDGYVDVPVCFSNHDTEKFGSSQSVHQYIMGFTDLAYSNQFLKWGNDSSTSLENTALLNQGLMLGYLIPTAEYTNTDDIVLLMHLNEEMGNIVSDSSSYHNDGILYNGEWTRQGRFGNAIIFNGQNTVCAVPYTDSLIFKEVTLDIWLNLQDRHQAQSIIERPGSFGLQVTDDGRLLFYIRDTSAMRWSLIQIAAPYTEFDHFAHILASYDGTFLHLIVNGEEIATDSHSGLIDQSLTGEHALYIGDNRSRTMPLQGIIDEIRISGSALSLPLRDSGTWVSQVIFPDNSYTQYGYLEFDHILNGGDVSYDILDENDNPLSGHTHISSSPHPISNISGPIKVRANLTQGAQIHTSPQVDRIRITRGDLLISPPQAHLAASGTTISYTHTLTKIGQGNDKLFFTASAPQNWSVDIIPNTQTIHHDSPINIHVKVQIPIVTNVHLNSINITATSLLHSMPATVNDTIKVFNLTYLPLVVKNH